MYDTLVTVTGHVASEPVLRTTSGGKRVVNFRVASTERRYDKGVAAWRDGDTIFLTVSCWHNAAENLADSVEKGQPVICYGRLKQRSYDDRDGQRRVSLEIEAYAVGHDLTKGVATFRRAAGTRRSEESEPVVAVVVAGEDAVLAEDVNVDEGSSAA